MFQSSVVGERPVCIFCPSCKKCQATDLRRLKTDEISWALGRKGATRKKLASASGCIVEYTQGSTSHAIDAWCW